MEGIAAMLLAFVVAGYMLLSFNRYLPVQEGWFIYYSQLMDQGKFPYRDFYVHIQPLYLYLVSGLGTIFGKEFIVLRIFGILERCLLGVLLFYYLKKHFSPVCSFFCVLFGIFIYSSFNVDLPYSYYQTSLLLTFLSAIFFLRAIDAAHYPLPNERRWMMLAGVMTALTFFTKQSSGLLFLMLYLMMIIIHYLRSAGWKAVLEKGFFFCAGFLLVAGAITAWLFSHNALSAYIHIVYGATSSKGNISAILFGFLTRLFTVGNGLINGLLFVLISGLILYSAWRRKDTLYREQCFRYNHLIVISILTIILTTAYCIPYLTASIGVTATLLAINQGILFMTFIGVALLAFLFSYRWVRQADDRRNNYYLFSSLFSLTWMYGHGMSGVLEVSALLPAFPFLVLFLLAQYRDSSAGKVFRTGIFVFGVMCVFLVACDRYPRPYYWWGWGEPDVRVARYSSDIPLFRGMRLSLSTKEFYERTYQSIIENSSVNDEVFTFPHIVLFNVITERTNSNFAPVTYFDVCSDEYAIKTAKYLIENKPKIIVMMEFPEDAWTVHETIFRGGHKSGQRQIVEAVDELKARGMYRSVYRGQVNGGYPVEILRSVLAP